MELCTWLTLELSNTRGNLMKNSNFKNNFSNFNQSSMWEGSRQEDYYKKKSGGDHRMMNEMRQSEDNSVYDMYSNLAKSSSRQESDMIPSSSNMMNMAPMMSGEMFAGNLANFAMGNPQAMLSGMAMMNQMMPANPMNQNLPTLPIPGNLSALAFGMNTNNMANAGIMNPMLPNLQMMSNTMAGGGNMNAAPWATNQKSGPPSPKPLMADIPWANMAPMPETDLRDELNRVRKQKSPGRQQFQSPPRNRSPVFDRSNVRGPARGRGTQGQNPSRFGQRSDNRWPSPSRTRAQANVGNRRSSFPDNSRNRPGMKRSKIMPAKGGIKKPLAGRDRIASRSRESSANSASNTSNRRQIGRRNRPNEKRGPTKIVEDDIEIPDNNDNSRTDLQMVVDKHDESENVEGKKDEVEEEVFKRDKPFLDDGEDEINYGIKPSKKSDDENSCDGDHKSDDSSDEMIVLEEWREKENDSPKGESPSKDAKASSCSETSQMDEILEDRLIWDDEPNEEKEAREWCKERNSLPQSSRTPRKRSRPQKKSKAFADSKNIEETNMSIGSKGSDELSFNESKSDRPKIKAPSTGASGEEDKMDIPNEKSILEPKFAELEFNKAIEVLADDAKVSLKTLIQSFIIAPFVKLPSSLDFLNWSKKNHNPLRVSICSTYSNSLNFINSSQTNFIIEELLSKMRNITLDNCGPQFTSFKRKRGCVLVVCSNTETLKWLKAKCKELESDIPLSVVDSIEKEGKRIAIQLTISGYFKNAEVEDIFLRLGEQNANIYPCCWVFLGRRKFVDKQCIVAAVGEISARSIIQNHMTLYLGLWTINVRVIDIIDSPHFGTFYGSLRMPIKAAEEADEDCTKDD